VSYTCSMREPAFDHSLGSPPLQRRLLCAQFLEGFCEAGVRDSAALWMESVATSSAPALIFVWPHPTAQCLMQPLVHVPDCLLILL
jgi:hypothetical protein